MLDHLQQQQQQLQVLSLSGAAGYHNHHHHHHNLSHPHQLVDLCGSPATPLALMNLNELGEANLLEMLQVLTRRRDELRLMDKQLFDLMAECFVRLKPATVGSPAAAAAAAVEVCQIEEVSAAIDLSRLGGSQAASEEEEEEEEERERAKEGRKRGASTRYSPSLHIKKMRLLSGIVSQDDIGEKQQVLAEKELDVREVGKDDEGRNKKQDEQKIWNSTTSSSSSISSSSLLSPPHEAYQQQQKEQEQEQANNNNNNNNHRQQHLHLHQQDHHRAIAAIDAPSPPAPQGKDENEQNNNEINNINNYCKRSYQAPQVAMSAASIQQQLLANSIGSSNNSSRSSCGSDQDDELAVEDHHGGGASTTTTTTTSNSSSSNNNNNNTNTTSTCNPGRPQLKKFYSIGTHEMSFERLHRQQHLIDSTLATLVQQQQQAMSCQQQQQQQQQANLLVPATTSANCFAYNNNSSSSSSSNKCQEQQHQHQQQVSMLSPLMLQPVSMRHMPHGHFTPCDQQACHESAGTMALPAGGVAPEQPLVYIQQQQHQQQKISSFDRMLAINAKDLGPIVRKMSFRCHVCSSCFEDRHRLQQHLSIHLNLHPSWFEEKTIKETMAQYELRRGDYLCQVCQLRYETTAEFDKHMHLHGEKPHQCELCQQDNNKFVSFRYFRQLLTHLRSHCFLYSCRFVPECRQTANRKDYLKLHILKHHLNNKLPEQFTICCH